MGFVSSDETRGALVAHISSTPRPVKPLEELVRGAGEADGYDLERAVLGSDDPSAVAAVLGGQVSRLGRVARALFYRRGTGIVVGFELSDGRRLVLKVHRFAASVRRLSAVQEVQRHLAMGGLPVPSPVLGPEALGSGCVTVETFRAGGHANGWRPVVRRAIAHLLADVVREGRSCSATTDLGEALLFGSGDTGWPQPHDLRFDFAATARGAEWIDEAASVARQRLARRTGPPVVGHMDWRSGNLGFEAARCSAIYDLDSLALAEEAVVVGSASAQFSVDWVGPGRIPSPAEMGSFVAEYEEARGEPFDGDARGALDAANLVQCAYGARCQHSDALLGSVPHAARTGGYIDALRQRLQAGHL